MKSSEASAIRKGDADSCFENRKLILAMVIRVLCSWLQQSIQVPLKMEKLRTGSLKVFEF
jgi:hypothetical protein